MRVLFFLALVSAAVAAYQPSFPNSQRIIGGSTTDIETYPEIAALLRTWDGLNYRQTCGGIIINNRSILTAAQCFEYYDTPSNWRVRVGSSNAHIGGIVYNVRIIYLHADYDIPVGRNDIGMLQLSTNIVYSNVIQPASIASSTYNLRDNQVVWAAGWGYTTIDGPSSKHLRHVQMWTVNQEECARRYASVNIPITDNLLCAGWLDVGGRDQCQGDTGGPLFHNGVVVGVFSWGWSCGSPYFPGINSRVSNYTTWIQRYA